MKYMSVSEAARKWGITERVVRDYCASERIDGAIKSGRKWMIPKSSEKPERKQREIKIADSLLERLRMEKASSMPGGIYHKIQIDLTYNSNHIEGSRLTHDQTRYIFETNTIGYENDLLQVDDVLETVNHFRCIDHVIDNAKRSLSEHMIKQLHGMLKAGTADSRKAWFAVGDYKRLENEVGGRATAHPKDVHAKMEKLLAAYNRKKIVKFEDLIKFHYDFEMIHPFQDGNGRIGRLILFKECLKNDIVPFIIEDDIKAFYYRGLEEWPREKGYLIDTCLLMQDKFKSGLDYFGIKY